MKNQKRPFYLITKTIISDSGVKEISVIAKYESAPGSHVAANKVWIDTISKANYDKAIYRYEFGDYNLSGKFVISLFCKYQIF